MLISAREAADVLAPLGLSRESTRRVLRAGLAGVGQATKASFLYEHERVVALCEWPLVDPGRLDAAVHGGVFVARLGAGLDVGQHASPDHWRNASRGPWRVSPWLRARMSITLERQSFVPLVATMGGFVVLGADITGGVLHPGGEATIGDQPGRTCTFTLAEPGAWFRGFEGHRFPTGPGAAWRWWQPGRDGLWRPVSPAPRLQE